MLPWAQYYYNTSYHHNIRMPAFKALYGKDPRRLIRYEFNVNDACSLQEMLQEMNKLLDQLKKNILRTQQYTMDHADTK